MSLGTMEGVCNSSAHTFQLIFASYTVLNTVSPAAIQTIQWKVAGLNGGWEGRRGRRV